MTELQQLPIGTVVQLVDTDINVMIIGQFPMIEKQDLSGYYDYMAVILPVGYDSKHTLFFNKEDIKTIVYLGYIDYDFQLFLDEAIKFENNPENRKLISPQNGVKNEEI